MQTRDQVHHEWLRGARRFGSFSTPTLLLLIAAGCGGGGRHGRPGAQVPAPTFSGVLAPLGAVSPKDTLIAVSESGRVFRSNGDGAGGFPAFVELESLGRGVTRGCTVADFDEDGILDFVAGEGGSGNLVPYLYHGNLDATYAPKVALPATPGSGSYAMEATAGDFNGDGHQDFIFNTNGSNVGFYFGDGMGGFTQETRSLGGYGRGMDAGDLNEDGKLDFVRARYSDGLVELYTGNGSGGFTASPIGTAPNNDPYGLAVADFDEDGHLDVIAGGASTGDTIFLKGRGDGTFAAAVSLPSADLNNYSSFDAFDLNRDGHVDLVAVTYTSRKVEYLPGNGDGSFGSPLDIRTSQADPSLMPEAMLGISTPPLPALLTIAVAPLDQTILAGGTANFQVTGAGLAGNTGINWTFGDGGSAAGDTVSHDYLAEGVYFPSVAVTAADGTVQRRKVRVQVNGTPPVASAGGPYVLEEKAANQDHWTAALDGSGSTDDKGIASYAWDFGDGASGAGAKVSHTWASRTAAGGDPWTVKLTVTDGATQTASESTTVTFNLGSPPAAVLNGPALIDETFAQNGVWTAGFNANGSADNGTANESGIWHFDWTFGDGGSASGQGVSHGYSAPGNYTVTLKVFDHANQMAQKTLDVVVKANAPPVARITGPTRIDESAAASGCWNSQWDSAASSDDVGLWKVEWNFGDGSAVSTERAPKHAFCGAGTYTVTLTVYDFGRQTASTTQDVEIVGSNPPVAKITASRTTVEGRQPFDLSGAGSTDDFGIVAYDWFLPSEIHDFTGPTINPAEWIASPGATQNDQLFLTGTGGWGGRYFYSTGSVGRGTIVQGRVMTPVENGTYCMVGFKNTSTDGNYPSFPYALYFNNGAINVYESGGSRGQFNTYTRGETYDFRIETTATGAKYSFKTAAATSFTPVYTSTYVPADGAFRVGATVYAGTWSFDDFLFQPSLKGIKVTTSLGQSGTIRLVVTDNALLTGTTTIDISTVTGNAPVAVAQGPSQGDLGVDLLFSGAGSSDDYGIASYDWDFGDGSTGSGVTVTHFYTAAGKKTVTLTVHDFADQIDVTSLTVDITGTNLVQTVPWRLVGDLEVPHDVISGKATRLKAVASNAKLPVNYTWDFGDGSATATGVADTLEKAYGIEAAHIYTGSDGTPFTAVISIVDADGNHASDNYPVQVRDQSLEVEMNVAIDEGLWYMHKTMARSNISASVRGGSWNDQGYTSCATSSSVQAFEINGHLPTGNAARDPYIETVGRGLNYLFTQLTPVNLDAQPAGDPDTNQNGIGLNVLNSRPIYELGQVIDALVAASAPDLGASTGGINVVGRPLKDLVHDCMDMYFWGQSDNPTYGGGWRYGWNQDADNSACQWAAIGCIPGQNVLGIQIPQWVKDQNLIWLNYSKSSNGFGYGGPGEGFATTPSGMVQLAMDDVQNTDPLWMNGENYIARNWQSFLASRNFYAYYALAKAMRVSKPQPISAFRLNGISWFLDPANGMARTLVNIQGADGHWASGQWSQTPLSTAWGVIILSSTLFQKPPVAVIHANPNPGAAGQAIHFDGSGSFHTDPVHHLVKYEWDFDDSNGIDFDLPDATGAVAEHAFPGLGTYTVTLRVTDDNDPVLHDTSSVQIAITIPPHPPTAVTGGPYIATTDEPVLLDGSGSFDIDASFGDTITAYGWEIDNVQPRDFADASGAITTIPGYPAAGTYSIGLRVTDDTSKTFPQADQPDLTNDAFTEITIYSRVITDLAARPKDQKIQLTWTPKGGPFFQVFRSELGPNRGFQHIASTASTFSTYLDQGIELNKRYFYRILVFTPGQSQAVGSSSTIAVTSSPRTRDTNARPRITSLPALAATAGAEYQYDVEAVDTDNDPLTFSVLGPTGMSIDASSGLITWTPADNQTGLQNVFVEVDDNKGGSDTQIFDVLVRPAVNLPPVAAANGPYTGLSGIGVAFSSAGSADPEGDPITFSWSFGDGQTSTEANPTHVYGAAGQYVATLFVRDDRGGVGTADAPVQIDAPNRPPVAAAGADASLRLGDVLSVDAAGSADPDGDPLTYTWNFGDSTPAVTTVKADHTFAAEGTYTVTLTVEDGRGGMGTDELIATVGGANRPPVIVAAGGGSGNIGDQFNFDGTGTTDPDGDPMTFGWTFGDGQSTSGLLVSHVFNSAGDFTVTFTATDNHGAASSATLPVHINAPPIFTSAPLLSVLEDQVWIYAPSASDADGDPVTIVLLNGPPGMALHPSGELTYSPTNADNGDHPVHLQAQDGLGGVADQEFTLTVIPVNDPPVFASTPVATGLELDPYSYQASAIDEEHDPLTFTLLTAPAAMSVGAATGLVAWAPQIGDRGDHPVTLQADDGHGNTAIQSWTITIRQVNQKPSFTSAPLLAAREHDPYLYDADAADPDSDPIVYALTVSPAGMTIDAASGLVRWTPQQADVGPHAVTITATDTFAAFDQQSFTVTVEAVNDPPVITSTAPLQAEPGFPYAYHVAATDPESDPISFALTAAPANMTINSGSGQIDWTPTAAQLGNQGVTVTATDSHSASSSQSFTIVVAHQPHPPEVAAIPSQVVQDPKPFAAINLDDFVTDIDNAKDQILWSVSGNALIAVSIDAARVATLTYAPGTRVTEAITFTATDPGHLTGSATANFTVAEPSVDTVTPDIVLTVTDAALLGSTVQVDAQASDNEGLAGVTLQRDGVGLSTSNLGGGHFRATFIASDIGVHTVDAEALDLAGNASHAHARVLVFDPSITTAPVAILTLPTETTEVKTITDVVGTADGADFADYRLEYAPLGTSAFTEFANGDVSTTDGTLAQFDPSRVANGMVVIRLTVRSLGNLAATAETTVLVGGENKLGNFSMTFTDLEIPVSGIPITIQRTYDSRTRGQSMDFGYGWKVKVVRTGTYINNRKPGDGWNITTANDFFHTPCFTSTDTKPHVTEIRFSDVEFYRFAFKVNMDGFGSSIGGGCQGTGSFDQIGGIPGATLDILGFTPDLFWANGGDQVVDMDTFDVYEPTAVRLTTIDGHEYDLELQGGLSRIGDPNGNSLFISSTGITHSSGKGIQFIRDVQGRITSIIDPMGKGIDYLYGPNGDLVSVTNRTNDTTSLVYKAGHYLRDIVDPLGNIPLRNEYDDDGRLVAHLDANGNRTLVETDPTNNSTTITDRDGKVSVLQTNDQGLITDASSNGNSVQMTYDANGNKLTFTDQLGNVRNYSYDAGGNLTHEKDALGNTYAYAYNARNQPTTIGDPEGRATSFAYDAKGNLSQIKDSSGGVIQAINYLANGNPSQITGLGAAHNLDYDASGNVTRLTGPNGADATIARDANGNPVSQSVKRTVNGAAVSEVTTFTHDASGRMTSAKDPLGNTRSFTYNANGQLASQTDPLGRVTTLTYDKRGNLQKTTYPDGKFEAFSYDLESRLAAVTDRGGRTRFYEYDADGRLTQTIHPDGSFSLNAYDAVGNLISTVDERGFQMIHDYDAARRQTQMTDPTGMMTLFAYNPSGGLASAIDPLGNETKFEYDGTSFGAQRLKKTIFPGGASIQLAHAPSGRIASRTDELGHTTAYEYDGAGNLVKVTNALGGITTYAYDEAGNLVRQTDANNHTTTFEYDAAGRRTKRTLPMNQVETMAYDAAGNLVSHTDFNGLVTTFAYDVMDRLIHRNLPGGAVESFAYSPAGKVATATDSRGSTSYTYDDRDRIVQIVEPDGSIIGITYDAAGNRIQVDSDVGTSFFAYDEMGRMVEMADPDGGTTTYVNDSLGRPALVLDSNGNEEYRTYDERGWLGAVEHTGPSGAPTLARFDYVRAANGQVITMTEQGVGQVDYTYDALGRLLQEVDNRSGAAVTTAYLYDAAGNRTKMTRGAVVTNYTYDANDRILTAGTETFTHDDAGNLTLRQSGAQQRQYAYDALGRLTSFTAPGGAVTTYAYDALGNRVTRDGPAGTTQFLVDPTDPSGLSQVLAEKDGNGDITASYARGRDLVSSSRGGARSQHHADALGSTRLLTDASGAATDSYRYDGYGNLLASTGTTANSRRFTGEELDPTLGLYHLRARHLDTSTGRFTTMDPFGGNLSDPRSIQKYAYAGNDPVNLADPSGLEFGGIGEVSISISIASTLASIAVVGYGIYTDIKDTYDKLKVLFQEIPRLKLNEKLTRPELAVRIIEIQIGTNINISLKENLGDGAVGKSYDIVKDLVGGWGGKIVAFIWSYSAGYYMTQLPEVSGKPAHYISCDFNRYIFQTYQLELLNGIATKPLKPALQVIGVYLAYFNFLALMESTLGELEGGPAPADPPGGACRVP